MPSDLFLPICSAPAVRSGRNTRPDPPTPEIPRPACAERGRGVHRFALDPPSSTCQINEGRQHRRERGQASAGRGEAGRGGAGEAEGSARREGQRVRGHDGRECRGGDGRWRHGSEGGSLFDVERERRVEHGSERGACRMPTLACPSVRSSSHIRPSRRSVTSAGRALPPARPPRAGSGPLRATSGRVATAWGGRPGIFLFPSKAALATVKTKIKEITRTGTNQSLDRLLHRLNPVLRGWCALLPLWATLADLPICRCTAACGA